MVLVHCFHSAQQVTGALNMVVRMTSDMETYIVGVERINEYANCPKEVVYIALSRLKSTIVTHFFIKAPEKVDMGRSLSHWPEQGRVELKNFSTRYRQGLNLVLNNVSVVINPMEKVRANSRQVFFSERCFLLSGRDCWSHGSGQVFTHPGAVPYSGIYWGRHHH